MAIERIPNQSFKFGIPTHFDRQVPTIKEKQSEFVNELLHYLELVESESEPSKFNPTAMSLRRLEVLKREVESISSNLNRIKSQGCLTDSQFNKLRDKLSKTSSLVRDRLQYKTLEVEDRDYAMKILEREVLEKQVKLAEQSEKRDHMLYVITIIVLAVSFLALIPAVLGAVYEYKDFSVGNKHYELTLEKIRVQEEILQLNLKVEKLNEEILELNKAKAEILDLPNDQKTGSDISTKQVTVNQEKE